MTDSFTMGTPEMVAEMFDRLKAFRQYPMSLNNGDMEALTFALAVSVGFVSWDDEREDMPELQERAMSLFASIAETLSVEGV